MQKQAPCELVTCALALEYNEHVHRSLCLVQPHGHCQKPQVLPSSRLCFCKVRHKRTTGASRGTRTRYARGVPSGKRAAVIGSAEKTSSGQRLLCGCWRLEGGGSFTSTVVCCRLLPVFLHLGNRALTGLAPPSVAVWPVGCTQLGVHAHFPSFYVCPRAR